MDTKLKGDVAEQAAILAALRRKWDVLTPIGDRLPYDLVFIIDGRFVKVQVKSAWLNEETQSYVVDNRRCKTNRKIYKIESYSAEDFDVALCYIPDIDTFYVMPVDVFVSYGGCITLESPQPRQRKPRASSYREAWNEFERAGYHSGENGGLISHPR